MNLKTKLLQVFILGTISICFMNCSNLGGSETEDRDSDITGSGLFGRINNIDSLPADQVLVEIKPMSYRNLDTSLNNNIEPLTKRIAFTDSFMTDTTNIEGLFEFQDLPTSNYYIVVSLMNDSTTLKTLVENIFYNSGKDSSLGDIFLQPTGALLLNISNAGTKNVFCTIPGISDPHFAVDDLCVLPFLPEGKFEVIFGSAGYISQTITIEIKSGENKNDNVLKELTIDSSTILDPPKNINGSLNPLKDSLNLTWESVAQSVSYNVYGINSKDSLVLLENTTGINFKGALKSDILRYVVTTVNPFDIESERSAEYKVREDLSLDTFNISSNTVAHWIFDGTSFGTDNIFANRITNSPTDIRNMTWFGNAEIKMIDGKLGVQTNNLQFGETPSNQAFTTNSNSKIISFRSKISLDSIPQWPDPRANADIGMFVSGFYESFILTVNPGGHIYGGGQDGRPLPDFFTTRSNFTVSKTDTWHDIIITFDESNPKSVSIHFWVDSVYYGHSEMIQPDLTIAPHDKGFRTSPLSAFRVGKNPLLNNAFYGLISEVQIDSDYILEPPSLVGHWDFNTSNLFKDQSTYGNDGEVTGNPSLVEGVEGSAFSFQGTQKIVIPVDQSLRLQNLTLAVWVKQSSIQEIPILVYSEPGIFGGKGTGVHWWLNSKGWNEVSSGSVLLNLAEEEGIGRVLLDTSKSVTQDSWHHLAATFDVKTGIASLYIDGALAKQMVQVVDRVNILPAQEFPKNFPFTDSDTLFIGYDPISNTSYIGAIDELKIYNKALDAVEIQTIFQSHTPPVTTPKAIGQWNLEEASGSALNDTSGLSNSLFISGASWSQSNIGNILEFNGRDNFLFSNGCLMNGTQCWKANSLTIEMWLTLDKVLPIGLPTANLITLSKQNGDISVLISQDNLQATFKDSDNKTWMLSTPIDTLIGKNTHFAYRYDPATSTFSMLINGNIVDSEVALGISSVSASQTSSQMIVGKSQQSSSNYFNGHISEFNIYNYPLSDQVIADNHSRASPQPVPSKMIAHWDFNEGSGNVLLDKSGNTNHGTLNGGSWVTGKEGTALLFNGLNEYVSIDKYPDFRVQKFTISAWIKATDISSGNHVIFSTVFNGGSFNLKQGYGFKIQGGEYLGIFANNVGAEIQGQRDKWIYTGSSINSDSAFYFVACTYDGSALKVYLNGLEIQSFNFTSGIDNEIINPTIGASPSNAFGNGFFNGAIDEMRVYNYALNGSEIQILYLQNQ